MAWTLSDPRRMHTHVVNDDGRLICRIIDATDEEVASVLAAEDMRLALQQFVAAEDAWRKEKSGMPAATFDDPLADAYEAAKAAIAKAGVK